MTPDDLRARFRATPARDVPTSALRRLWKTGRGAMGAAGALLGRRGDDDGDGPDDADLAKIAGLATQLGELKGIAMKAGQILGYVDASLPPEVRGLLALLQTQAPASPWPVVEATVREALGDRADALLAGLDREPIAVASIGQVHHGRLPDGTEVAVKVRHRGIEAAMRADFRAARIGPVMATLFGAGGAVRGMIDEARQAFLEECDLGLEADRQDELRRLFAGHPTIVIPEVVRAYSATAVLTTRWLPGRTLDAFLAAAPSQAARDRAGVALFELYVATLYRHGVFHADPHPGNYAFRDDGKVVIYDFGCVRRFEPEMVAALAALVAAVRADDAAAIADAMRGLGATPPRGD
ncbi:MAG: AarF/ABC1/UbiB kinase family protein, partial [Myxococcales bacterium]|nr:AarF/ABC1/UbiB kinase family protein [Myxococcales bacterium]